MAIREFFTHKEVCDQIGDSEAVRQAIIAGKLAAYVELVSCSCTVRSRNEDFPADGRNQFAEWFDVSGFMDEPHRKVKEGPLSGWFESEYMLTGWFRVEASDSASIARGPDDAFRVCVIAERSDGTSAPFRPDEHINVQELWFRAADVETLSSSEPLTTSINQKPLDTRERTTLLCIIGALAEHAKLDLSQPMKAGETVAAMMPGVKISGRTIGEHLKTVREAMDSRKG